jgi:hypothetical protein
LSLLSGDLLKDCEEGVRVIEELQTEAINDRSTLRDIERLNQYFYCFRVAFFYHQVKGNIKIAKRLYKEAIRRSEHPVGCFNMMLSIYIKDYTNNKQEGRLEKLQRKVQKLESSFQIVFRNNKQIHESRNRVYAFMKNQLQKDPNSTEKNIIVLEIESEYKTPKYE